MTLKPLRLSALALLTLLAACSTTPPEPTEPVAPVKKASAPVYEAVAFSALPASEKKDWELALGAFRHSCTTIGKLDAWREVCLRVQTVRAGHAREFFEANFTPWKVEVAKYENNAETGRQKAGLMTGYFEPLLFGSRVRQAPFVHPIYGVPDDLLVIDLVDLYPELKGMRLRGKLEGRRVVPYDTRGVIQKRTDLDRWAIAWVDDPIASFFLHVQGSGRILLPDGTYMRVGFADQNGYRYRSIGTWLVEKGHLKPHELSMQRIRAWAKENPKRVEDALAQNPSYVFFEERNGDPNLGPTGAQGVPLTPRASVAVDPKFWALGTPAVVSVSQEKPALRFVKPVVAQDTGGAIRGPIRFDFFWGFGDDAGAAAGRQKSRVEAWMLVPNGLEPRDLRR